MKYHDFLKEMDGCPFCGPKNQKIIKENDTAYLTYSLAPYHPDHLLVCPKRHAEHLLELTPEEIKDIDALQKEGLAALEKLGYSDVTIMVREGLHSGKSVPHSHYHLIPVVLLDAGVHGESDRSVLTIAEQEMLIEKMRAIIL